MTLPDYIRQSTGFADYRAANGVMVRAYVLQVYAASDPSASTSPAANSEPEKIGSVLCDVMVIEPGYRGVLNGVPVLTTAGGLDNAAYWRPIPLAKTTTGIPVSMKDAGHLLTIDPADTDADLVIVGFLGNDLTRPVIVGHLTKPNSRHARTLSNVNAYDWANFAAGAVVGVEPGGRIVIDTTGQATNPLADDEVVIRTGNPVDGVTITVQGPNVTIDAGHVTGTVTVNAGAASSGIALNCGELGVTEATGNLTSALHPTQEVALANAIRDITVLLTTWWTVIQTALAFFGLTDPTSAAIIASLNAGVDTTGASYTSKSLKAD